MNYTSELILGLAMVAYLMGFSWYFQKGIAMKNKEEIWTSLIWFIYFPIRNLKNN